MLKPGRKSNANCPADLHLKLPDEIREIIDSLGPGNHSTKIINLLRREAKRQKPDTVLDLQMEVVNIQRQIKDLTKCEKDLLIRLQSVINDDREFERVTVQIHNTVFPEKPI